VAAVAPAGLLAASIGSDALGVVLFVLFILAGLTVMLGPTMVRLLLGQDRRITPFSDSDPLWSGRFCRSQVVPLHVTVHVAMRAVRAAMASLRAQEVITWPDGSITGWLCRTNFTADKQLGATIQKSSDGGCEVLCCCRPRYTWEVTDLGSCARHVRKLVDRVHASLAELDVSGPTASRT
jgi:hypothetical protein